MNTDEASAKRYRRPGYPPVEELNQALDWLRTGNALTSSTNNSLFAELATDQWKQWLLQHPGLPVLRVQCHRCGYWLGKWELSYGHHVAMPVVKLRHPVDGVVPHTVLVADDKGRMKETHTNDGRGSFTYHCPGRNCAYQVKLNASTRTTKYLKALLDNKNVITV